MEASSASDVGDAARRRRAAARPAGQRRGPRRACAELAPRRMRVIVPDRPGYGRTRRRGRGLRGNAPPRGRACWTGLAWTCGDVRRPQLGRRGGAGRGAAGVRARGRAGADLAGHSGRPAAGGSTGSRRPAFGPPLLRTGFGLAGPQPVAAAGAPDAAAALPGVATRTCWPRRPAWRREPVWRSFFVEQRALIERAPRAGPGARPRSQSPVTVLIGSRDRVVTPRNAMRLASRFRGARCVTRRSGAGHLLPQQRPELVARAS